MIQAGNLRFWLGRNRSNMELFAACQRRVTLRAVDFVATMLRGPDKDIRAALHVPV